MFILYYFFIFCYYECNVIFCEILNHFYGVKSLIIAIYLITYKLWREWQMLEVRCAVCASGMRCAMDVWCWFHFVCPHRVCVCVPYEEECLVHADWPPFQQKKNILTCWSVVLILIHSEWDINASSVSRIFFFSQLRCLSSYMLCGGLLLVNCFHALIE